MEKSTKFDLYTKTLYLTFPRCSMEPKKALENIYNKLDPEYCIVCREKHKPTKEEDKEWTTQLHLHCVIRLKTRQRWRSYDCMDFITGTHGNYQSARNITHVVLYVTKGTDYVSKGIDVESFKKAAKNKKRRVDQKCVVVSDMIRTGKKISEVEDFHPGYFMMNMAKIKAYVTHCDTRGKKEKKKKEWKKIDVNMALSEAGKDIIRWLNDNIFTYRKFKQPQLWIYGPKNTGKTSMMRWLEQYVRIYDIPPNNWDDMYDDDGYDLAFYDEFKGSKTITYMNRFTQGGRCPLLRRNVPVYIKQNNIPVIILSNLDIVGSYPNTKEVVLEALESRFLQVELKEGEFLGFYQTKEEKLRGQKKNKGTKRKRISSDATRSWIYGEGREPLMQQHMYRKPEEKKKQKTKAKYCCHRQNYCNNDHGGVKDWGLCTMPGHVHKKINLEGLIKATDSRPYKVYMSERPVAP